MANIKNRIRTYDNMNKLSILNEKRSSKQKEKGPPQPSILSCISNSIYGEASLKQSHVFCVCYFLYLFT